MADRETQILYVDDELPNRTVFQHAFGAQFRVKTAASAEQALELLALEPFGVIVTDQRMPGLSGNELLERVKEAHPEVVRVIITAYSDIEPILRAVNGGLVARYVIKPWDLDELRETLAWACEAFIMGQHRSALQQRLLQTERLAMLGSVSSAVLHDIVQPISALSMDAERLVELSNGATFIETWLGGELNALTSEARVALTALSTELPEIAADIRDGSRFLRDILARMPRLLTATGTVDEASADPIAAIRYASSLCREELLLAGAKIEYVGPERLPALRIHSADLLQVLMNLLLNAAQALERGGIAGGTVRVDACPRKDIVEFTITDTGPGMDASILRDATKPFFTTRPEGTGLGLAQCRRIVEGRGGSFLLESAPSSGTTVRFTVECAS